MSRNAQKRTVRCVRPNEDTSQPAHPRSYDQRLRYSHVETFYPLLSKMPPVKFQIRLRKCAVWSESPLGAHVRRCVFRSFRSYFNDRFSDSKLISNWTHSKRPIGTTVLWWLIKGMLKERLCSRERTFFPHRIPLFKRCFACFKANGKLHNVASLGKKNCRNSTKVSTSISFLQKASGSFNFSNCMCAYSTYYGVLIKIRWNLIDPSYFPSFG